MLSSCSTMSFQTIQYKYDHKISLDKKDKRYREYIRINSIQDTIRGFWEKKSDTLFLNRDEEFIYEEKYEAFESAIKNPKDSIKIKVITNDSIIYNPIALYINRDFKKIFFTNILGEINIPDTFDIKSIQVAELGYWDAEYIIKSKIDNVLIFKIYEIEIYPKLTRTSYTNKYLYKHMKITSIRDFSENYVTLRRRLFGRRIWEHIKKN